MQFLIVILLSALSDVHGQVATQINALTFGLVGDGKTDNTQAFLDLSGFINSKAGNVSVFIPSGVYLAGRQKKTTEYFRDGVDVIDLENVSNVSIKGEKGTVIMFNEGLLFGSFKTETLSPIEAQKDFYDRSNACRIGSIINIENCKNITIESLVLKGNDSKQVVGGVFGDIGIQLDYNGIKVKNTKRLTVQNVIAEHFGLDGIQAGNEISDEPDSILIKDSRFAFNGRQGFSWVGGNDMKAVDCVFENTGNGAIHSLPGAGVDIEAEAGPNRNGYFLRCKFENNQGAGVVSATGDNANCTFEDCTFWGVLSYATWITKPGFHFEDCKFYGMVQHGFGAKSVAEATTYSNCTFSDDTYNGKMTWGGYLVDANNASMMRFDECHFIVNRKKAFNLSGKKDWPYSYHYVFNNCIVDVHGQYNPADDFSTAEQCSFSNTSINLPPSAYSNKNYLKGVMPQGTPQPASGINLKVQR